MAGNGAEGNRVARGQTGICGAAEPGVAEEIEVLSVKCSVLSAKT